MIRRITLLVIVLGSLPAFAQTTRPVPRFEHVVIISVDGMRPDILLRANTPRMHLMLDEGSFTMWARTTAQSTTLPSHVSMLTGVVPEVHGVLWNGTMPFSEPVYPKAPTIFELAKKRGLKTAMVVSKNKFDILDKPGSIDWKYVPKNSSGEDADAANAAVQIIRADRPNVLFVHFASVDAAGHGPGWGTPEQLAAAAHVDQYVGRILDALVSANIADSTMVILTADHGGAGRTHGPDDVRSRTIPWIAVGPGIRKGYDLARLGREVDVDTYDTFATSCAVLDIPIQRKINGKCLWQIFSGEELMTPTTAPDATMK